MEDMYLSNSADIGTHFVMLDITKPLELTNVKPQMLTTIFMLFYANILKVNRTRFARLIFHPQDPVNVKHSEDQCQA